MTLLRLDRSYTPKGTFGLLYLPDWSTLYTLECPWKQNQPDVSCIPEGLYQLTKDRFKDLYDNYRIINPPPGRYAIEIHRANTLLDLRGCIGVGLWLGDRWNIRESKDALTKLVEALEGKTDIQLHIRSYRPSMGLQGNAKETQ
jgi:hypothetical protein